MGLIRLLRTRKTAPPAPPARRQRIRLRGMSMLHSHATWDIIPRMGLDSVELVMEVEDRFGVHLPDSECSRVTTVADLAALVISRLPRGEGACPTARAFFDFRTLMTTHAGFDRHLVRPKAQLIDLFPPGTRRLWSSLHGKNRRVPRLVPTARADSVLLWAGAITAFAWLMASAALWGFQGAVVAIPMSMIALAAGLLAFMRVYSYFSQHFPPGIETVGDVVRLIAPIAMPQGSPGERLIAQQRVLDEIRALTARQLRLPLERVQPNSDFVKDLEID